ncbi:MAG: class I mannose-6-phosphate isomerase [Ruminococcus sp.]|nr:class I mannose-6-phosphate isomerase [Ruminococcus sp.]
MKPFELKPPIKDYIWGGTRLREEYGKVSDLERLAESWELSCHKDGQSVIASGEFAGMTLAEFAKAHPEVLGENCRSFENFPVLIKLIDARDNLSVQVHPDDEYALRVEGEYGKTEMWYIVDCEEGAQLIYGFKNRISREDFRRAIEENTLLDCVNSVPVKKGDVFFIQSGTLHAIGKGILIAEIQQNSNTTYRVYDYGRVGADGKPRQLHVDKALEVTSLEPPAAAVKNFAADTSVSSQEYIAGCRYFSVDKLECRGEAKVGVPERSFLHLLVISGEGTAEFADSSIALRKGTSVFVPAGKEAFNIKGNSSMIVTTIPDNKEDKSL